jgi:hypothetical protein
MTTTIILATLFIIFVLLSPGVMLSFDLSKLSTPKDVLVVLPQTTTLGASVTHGLVFVAVVYALMMVGKYECISALARM